MLLTLLSLAWAQDILVVGLHLPDTTGESAQQAADDFAEAISKSSKFDVLAAAEVSGLITGRQPLILDQYAMGRGLRLLSEGQVLYDRAEPDQAIPVLEEAVQLLIQGLAISPNPNNLQNALVLLATCQLTLGETDAARASFERLALLNPDRELDPVNHAPQVISLYNEVRSALKAQASATLTVTASVSTPAEVYIDGRKAGAAPVTDLSLPPGRHYLLVRANDGASYFSTGQLVPGGTHLVEAQLNPRSLGTPAADVGQRSQQTKDLYEAIGNYAGGGVIAFGGLIDNRTVGIQLYSPQNRTFSRVITADAGNDPAGTLMDLAPTVLTFLDERGQIRADRVSSQVLGLDVSTNDVLAGLLLASTPASSRTATEPRSTGRTQAAPDETEGKSLWWLWTGLGVVVAGGGTTAAVLLLQPEPEPVNNGTIEVVIP